MRLKWERIDHKINLSVIITKIHRNKMEEKENGKDFLSGGL